MCKQKQFKPIVRILAILGILYLQPAAIMSNVKVKSVFGCCLSVKAVFCLN